MITSHFLYDHFSDQMVIRQNLCLKCIFPFQTIFLPCHEVYHFFSGAYITHWLKMFTFHFYSYLKLPLNRPLDTKWIGRA